MYLLWPLMMAVCRAVHPRGCRQFTSTPLSSNRLIVDTSPSFAAMTNLLSSSERREKDTERRNVHTMSASLLVYSFCAYLCCYCTPLALGQVLLLCQPTVRRMCVGRCQTPSLWGSGGSVVDQLQCWVRRCVGRPCSPCPYSSSSLSVG